MVDFEDQGYHNVTEEVLITFCVIIYESVNYRFINLRRKGKKKPNFYKKIKSQKQC